MSRSTCVDPGRIGEEARRFTARFGRRAAVQGRIWQYHRLGDGPPVLWLTGGLRQAALGSAVLERLAARHTVIAPDYPPVRTAGELVAGFDEILAAEGIGGFALAGQSYGGLLAQVYLAHRPEPVKRLVLSSSGPASYSRLWLPVDDAAAALARLLPERTLQGLITRALLSVLPAGQREAWRDAMAAAVRDGLSREGMISHFAVAADWIRRGLVRASAYRGWTGDVVVLAAGNDPTQSRRDIPRYERLFGRPVARIDMGDAGHVAALLDPDRYVGWLEQALGDFLPALAG